MALGRTQWPSKCKGLTVPGAAVSQTISQRASLLARDLTDRLFSQIRPDSWFDRPIPERHRLIFYLGHLEAFDWNLIGRAALEMKPVDAALDQLFAFGIDPPPGQLPTDQPTDWPSLDQTRRYVSHVRDAIGDIMECAPVAALDMAREHRLMHAETLIYMLHQMPYERRITSDQPPAPSSDSPPLEMIEIPGGETMLGREQDGQFGWDNEFGAQTVFVSDFAMSRHKITNGQYLRFVNDGGERPLFWTNEDGEWRYRSFDREIPLPLDWPVYVNHHQAQAYADWSKRRLPTEAQFQHAAYGSKSGERRAYPWGEEPPDSLRSNANFHQRDLVSVNATPSGDSAFGVSQLIGNGWEWTRTEFGPLPGFEAHPWYPGYSAAFFDGDHFVVKSASPVTDASLIRPTFRNWFRRGYPYAYTTFRVVEE